MNRPFVLYNVHSVQVRPVLSIQWSTSTGGFYFSILFRREFVDGISITKYGFLILSY